jgi:hypothetical protein
MTFDDLHALPRDQIAPTIAAMTQDQLYDLHAELIRLDLARHPELAEPEYREMIDAFARLAARLSGLTRTLRVHGGSTSDAEQHVSVTESLLRGLVALGHERTSGSMAAAILREALTRNDDLAFLSLPVGTA